MGIQTFRLPIEDTPTNIAGPVMQLIAWPGFLLAHLRAQACTHHAYGEGMVEYTILPI